MNTPELLATNLIGLGLVSRARVHQRTQELTKIAGRAPLDVSQSDYDQAKRDVTGESDPERQEAMLDRIAPANRRGSTHGPTGGSTPEFRSEADDNEERGETEPFINADDTQDALIT